MLYGVEFTLRFHGLSPSLSNINLPAHVELQLQVTRLSEREDLVNIINVQCGEEHLLQQFTICISLDPKLRQKQMAALKKLHQYEFFRQLFMIDLPLKTVTPPATEPLQTYFSWIRLVKGKGKDKTVIATFAF